MNKKKMLNLTLRLLLDIFLVIGGLILVLAYTYLHPKRLPIQITPLQLGMDYEEIKFSSQHQVSLSGWFIPAEEPQGTIIACHGYPANKSNILGAVSFLHPEFNLFLFDFRAHGESGGRFVTFGVLEDGDILGAISYLKQREDTKNLPIGIWGYSLGGACAIKVASQTKDISAVVTDSTYANFPEIVPRFLPHLGPLGNFLGGLSRLLTRGVFKVKPEDWDPEKLVAKIDAPIFIIHTEGDPLVPVEHARRIYENASEPRQLYLLPGSTHAAPYSNQDEEKIREFFRQYLSRERK